MYCPKCGNEIKNESSFCPKCGTQIHNRIQKPARQKTSSGKVPKINTEALSVMLQKYKALLVCGVALVFVLFFITRIWDPTIPPLDAEAVMSVYLTEQVSYSKTEELYRECFTYETENLIDLTVEQLEPIFDRMGVPLKNNGTDSRINDVKDGITEYFSQKPENQKKLVQAITQYSEFHMVNENRKGKKVKANMNVSYLDLSAVNSNILEDSISFAGIGSLFLEGVNLGTLPPDYYTGQRVLQQMRIQTGTGSFIERRRKILSVLRRFSGERRCILYLLRGKGELIGAV